MTRPGRAHGGLLGYGLWRLGLGFFTLGGEWSSDCSRACRYPSQHKAAFGRMGSDVIPDGTKIVALWTEGERPGPWKYRWTLDVEGADAC